ncbi:hypothetical protein H6G33_38105 [Calothrix sp. FACHB-1219]|uniref:SprT-like domain-containing protein n=1 Tax=unclassified Calothrix TaxID=2619626 RepID=UPI00168A2D98|nr:MULTISPECIES: SprT-like domain-containing protein [unclassified Calothrix]MBD2208204.1 hypothetical protein [Calothrix sp. FACHB-168]MBD2222734.1 hypothetical protein [Calothrix sp. FACHB-1219]
MKSIEQSIQLTGIYRDLNNSLFDGQLSNQIYVGVGYTKGNGIYLHSKWDEKNNINHDDQILVNENLLNESKEIWLSVLVHQMIHKWQHDFGSQKTLRHYHNKEYVEKAASIGFIIKSGESSEQSTELNGKFMQVIQTIDVEDLAKPRNVSSQLGQESKSGVKAKYTCPECGFNSWAKPGVTNICCNCNGSVKKMIEQIK